jgi:PAS domain S-box-containing protein
MARLATLKPLYRKVVAALVESEERYRVLVEGVRRYAIFMLDPKGIILTWNRGIQELLGYNREEIVGQIGAVVFNGADRAAGTFKKQLAEAKRTGESVREHLNVRKDGTEVLVHDTVAALHDSAGALLGYAKVARRSDLGNVLTSSDSDVELAKALATTQVEVEYRRRLEAQLLTAIEEERERVGRDLHDDLSQRLAAVAMMTRTLAKPVEGRSESDREKITQIGEMLADAVGVTRNLCGGLHPVTLSSQGLPGALAELAARVPSHVEFKWPKSERLDLESSVALHAYRIAEEAVGNAIRHAEADKIRIELQTISARKVALTITDNGKGFRRGGKAGNGMGLRNMKYRAGVIGGAFKITTAPGRGTVVKCALPLRQRTG